MESLAPMLGGLEVENQVPDFFQRARTEVGLFRWTASYPPNQCAKMTFFDFFWFLDYLVIRLTLPIFFNGHENWQVFEH